MKPSTKKRKKKHFLIKAFHHLWQIEQAIMIIRENSAMDSKLSVLGKLDTEAFSDETTLLNEKISLETHWKKTLRTTKHFGFFYNPEIGTIYIAGPLAPIFLHEVDGKKLGAMSSGPYGILRGLDFKEEEALRLLRTLHKGGYLIVVRAFDEELKYIENSLQDLDKSA
ncbi:hypothetical protein [Arenibacter nanhaiticus]|nr:hypothetical protein [Arenibacter nanhaiticus]